MMQPHPLDSIVETKWKYDKDIQIKATEIHSTLFSAI